MSALPERELLAALRPWTRRLALEQLARWLVRGGIAAALAACAVLAVAWLTPRAQDELRPVAANVALPIVLVGLIVGLWPRRMVRRAAELDTRLNLADRLATAWLSRTQGTPFLELQRADALGKLADRAPRQLPLLVSRYELGGLAVVGLLLMMLLVVRSPMQTVLDQIAAEQQAAQQAAQQIDQMREDATLAALAENLTPEQARKLDELLQQAQTELAHAQTKQDAQAVLARAQQAVAQLGDPAADERDEALDAMAETLSQEPLARSLGDALQRNDPRATQDALRAMNERLDQLSDAQRQGLSRALQRAANVGRADSRTSEAVRRAARAVAAGEDAEGAFQDASTSLEDAMRAAASQAALRSATQRLDDVRTGLETGVNPGNESSDSAAGQSSQLPFVPNLSGTAVPVDSGGSRRGGAGSQGSSDPLAERTSGAGVGASGQLQGQPVGLPSEAENVFVPGVVGEGETQQDTVQQPFSVRGAPRPYREVIGQYAQSGRDYVDRASVAPSVRELVRQYFAGLEGQ